MKYEPLEIREVDLVDNGFWKMATAKFGNADVGQEVQGRRWHLPSQRRPIIDVSEYKFVQSGAASQHGVQRVI